MNGASITENTTYKTIPLLPVQIVYPQTASILMLPLAANTANPPVKILAIGGSAVDNANSTTPASNIVYTLDLSQAAPVWTQETMSAPRVMPDGVLLPDGTVCIVNGGEIGIAGK